MAFTRVCDNIGVKIDSADLSMSCLPTTDSLVARILQLPSRIAGLDFMYSLEALKHCLNAPKAPSPNDGLAQHP